MLTLHGGIDVDGIETPKLSVKIVPLMEDHGLEMQFPNTFAGEVQTLRRSFNPPSQECEAFTRD